MVNKHHRAFALPELVVTIVMAAVVCSLLVVLSPRSRQMAWQAGSIANLHEYAAATGSYQADYTDHFWSYSWRYGEPGPSQYPDLQGPPTDAIEAAAHQAVDILRRRANRPDMPVVDSWLPSHEFSQLVLADYLEAALPLRFSVSPGDKNRVQWSGDIAGFDQGTYTPTSPDPRTDPQNKRWPYSSSYRVPLAFFGPDALTATTGTFWGGDDHVQIVGPPFNIGERRVTEVRFPSHKVFVFDMAQWSGVKQPVFGRYSFARMPLLFTDGSAHVRATSLANPGFQPNVARSYFPSSYWYTPRAWDPPVVPNTSALLLGEYYWTRGGIQGRDFDGPEIDTSNW